MLLFEGMLEVRGLIVLSTGRLSSVGLDARGLRHDCERRWEILRMGNDSMFSLRIYANVC